MIHPHINLLSPLVGEEVKMELVMGELEVMVEVVMLEMHLLHLHLQEIMLYKALDQVVVVLDTLLQEVMVVPVVPVLS
jgi:hypothetical protein